MKSFTQNSDSTTKWLTPDIVQYIVDSEQFRTQLMRIPAVGKKLINHLIKQHFFVINSKNNLLEKYCLV